MQKYQKLLDHPFDTAQAIFATYNLSADIIPSIKGGASSTFDEVYDFTEFFKLHPVLHL